MFAGQDNEESSVCAARAQIRTSNDHAVRASDLLLETKALRCSYLATSEGSESTTSASEKIGQVAHLLAS